MSVDVEALFTKVYVRPKEGRTLIVGSRIYKEREDRRKRYKDVVGVDMLPGPGVDEVANLEDPASWRLGNFAHIECFSVLEHSKKPWLLAETLELFLVCGGTIEVRVPFIWRLHAYPDDYWRFTPSAIRELFPSIEWDKIMFANTGLHDETEKIPKTIIKEHKYFAQTETFGFGRKR